MEKFNAVKIPADQVSKIREFIEFQRNALEAENGVHLNAILREDIFPLLDRFCTVVYFPTDDKENNGFHVSYPFRDKMIHFVYINTAQYREKQIFTAAHELGHIWELGQYLEQMCCCVIDAEYCERIMNRFAAELLMPEKIFDDYAHLAIQTAKKTEKLTIGEMLQAITAMMNEFFVPYKAVVYRLYEQEIISESVARLLWGELTRYPRTMLEDFSQKTAQEQGFSRLYVVDKRRGIDGLKDLLDAARNGNRLPTQWLEEFYKRFKLQYTEGDGELDNPLPALESGDSLNA